MLLCSLRCLLNRAHAWPHLFYFILFIFFGGGWGALVVIYTGPDETFHRHQIPRASAATLLAAAVLRRISEIKRETRRSTPSGLKRASRLY